jgi:hypothetical protein
MKNNLYFNLYQNFLKFVKKYLFIIAEKFEKFDKTYPNTSRIIQLSCIYFFAVIDLFHSILNNVLSLSYFPENVNPFLTGIQEVLESPFFKIWGSPEKVFLLSYVVIELMITRSVIKFPKFIKYNIILVFALLMLQGLVISFWDFIFHREISDAVSNWTYDEGMIVATNKALGVFFYLITFIIFLGFYYYFYSNALKGKLATIKNFYWLTDSVAFWLRIKTPTMKRFGGKNKKS